MEIMLQCLNMTTLEFILYLIQVLIMALIVGVPASCVGLYLFHLVDCINEPDRNDWKFWGKEDFNICIEDMYK